MSRMLILAALLCLGLAAEAKKVNPIVGVWTKIDGPMPAFMAATGIWPNFMNNETCSFVFISETALKGVFHVDFTTMTPRTPFTPEERKTGPTRWQPRDAKQILTATIVQKQTTPHRVYDMIADKDWSSVTYVLGEHNGVPHLFTFPLGGYTGKEELKDTTYVGLNKIKKIEF